MKQKTILDVKQLQTYFYLEADRVAKAVDDITFSIHPGETVALVGESGSGKSMAALSIMQLIRKPGRIKQGSIRLEGKELLQLTNRQMAQIRGKDIAMIFQEPMTALNPVYTIGNQIGEILRKHQGLNRQQAKQEAINLLQTVGIPRATEIIHEHPHQLSGGMRQRVMIAMAIACKPKLLIADEPTTALDVTIQAQILDLLMQLKEQFHMSLLLITHDLGVVSEYADRVIVMYGGQMVEEAAVKELLQNPKHPYTDGLLASLPNMEEHAERLGTIRGTVPPAYAYPAGCRFSTRCPAVMDICHVKAPSLKQLTPEHQVRCHLYANGGDLS
ncbi:ABC transporter ATP-binding protein [Ornithinibacillus gellani]|uniref:ABC transporter ATP-binding protein n=1 Tax=Ornithinibacillus gellani TaxID=2293253 RepID=UPI000F49E550|nr:ABC transporter ATP-binding protein [Ornithinibacillus gellani]TQS75296.1 ABC transporter ATP-binding protein [Ornithinibacillus gellani]